MRFEYINFPLLIKSIFLASLRPYFFQQLSWVLSSFWFAARYSLAGKADQKSTCFILCFSWLWCPIRFEFP